MSPKAERYVGVILEHINGKLDHILEVMPLLDGRISRLETRMDLVEKRLDELEGRVDDLTTEIKEMRKELHVITSNKTLFTLEERVKKIEQALA